MLFPTDTSFEGRSRLAVAVRSRGCAHARSFGPCIYCACLNDPLCCQSPDVAIRDFAATIQEYAGEQIDVVSLLCPGSFLDEQDLPRHTAEEMVRSAIDSLRVETVTVESRPTFVSDASVEWLRGAAAGAQVEIAIGFDTVSDSVRNGVIGKKISRYELRRAVQCAKRRGTRPVPFVVAQPPGVTRAQAVAEAVSTVIFLRDLGVTECWMEPVLVVAGSRLQELWEAGEYRLPEPSIVDEIEAACSEVMGVRRGGDIASPRVVAPSAVAERRTQQHCQRTVAGCFCGVSKSK